MNRRLVPLIFLSALAALSAAAPSDPLDLVRQGNEAVARDDYDSALSLYSQAEITTTDPGLIAFNKGVVYYRLKNFREAGSCFERCLEDATGPRRAQGLYNLGNSCLQQAGPKDVKLLARASALYEQCLEMAELDPQLAEDARHNLELAKQLWLKAKGAAEQNGNTGQSETDPPPKEPEPKGKPNGENTGERNPRGSQAGTAEEHSKEPGHQAETSEPGPPGMGTLPPIPDTDQLRPMSPEDTAKYLQQAAERISRERKTHRQRSHTSPRQVMDW